MRIHNPLIFEDINLIDEWIKQTSLLKLNSKDSNNNTMDNGNHAIKKKETAVKQYMSSTLLCQYDSDAQRRLL